MKKAIKQILSIPTRLYKWTEKLAESKHAERSLYLLSTSEAVFFPIPPDPLLMALIFHKSKENQWIRYTLLTVLASVVGGIIGYMIGWTLFESVGDWLISNLHIKEGFDSLSKSFRENGSLFVFTAAITPIPYKIVTLTAGASGVNFGVFLIASIIGRGLRFIAVGALAHYLGKKHKDKIEQYINYVSLLIITLMILLVFLVKG